MTDIVDPYKVLDISSSATPEEIKKAYRRLSKQYHPDPNNGTGDRAKFEDVTKAHDILSDPDKKRSYDDEVRVEQEEREEQERKARDREKRRKEAKAKGIGDMFGDPPPKPPKPPRPQRPTPTTFTATATASATATVTVTLKCPPRSLLSTVSATASATAACRGWGRSTVSQEDAQQQAQASAQAIAEAKAKAMAETKAETEAEQRRKEQEDKERARREAEAKKRTEEEARAEVREDAAADTRAWLLVAAIVIGGIALIALIAAVRNGDPRTITPSRTLHHVIATAPKVVLGKREASNTGILPVLAQDPSSDDAFCEEDENEVGSYWSIVAKAGQYIDVTWKGAGILFDLPPATAGSYTSHNPEEAAIPVEHSGINVIGFRSCKRSTPYTFTVNVETPGEERHIAGGVSIATAYTIVPGEQEDGNTDAVPYGEGSCGPETGEYWQIELNAGEKATINWGWSGDDVTGLDIWPPGATNISGSNSSPGRLAWASIQEGGKTTFTAGTQGLYPIVFDDSCGKAGPYHFTVDVQPPQEN